MTEPRCPAAPGFSNVCDKAFPSGVVLRAANQNLTIASGNCTIMYRWHGAAVTDEGLASPSGRGAGGGEGEFYPLSRLRRQLPQRGSQGKTDCDRRESTEGATSVCAQASDDLRIWLCAGTDRQDMRRNWKRFSEVPKTRVGRLWKKRKIISSDKKGLISRKNCCKLKAWKR